MRRWRRSSDDGSAALELVTAGVLLLLPLVYLVLVVAAVQSAALAVEGAARHAARVFAQAGSAAEADASAVLAAEVALRDYGIDADSADIAVDCAPVPDQCLTRGGTVRVTVATTVTLPLVPAGLDVADRSGIPIGAAASQPVSRFWGSA